MDECLGRWIDRADERVTSSRDPAEYESRCLIKSREVCLPLLFLRTISDPLRRNIPRPSSLVWSGLVRQLGDRCAVLVRLADGPVVYFE